MARAALHLLDSVGRTEGLQAKLLDGWIEALAAVVRRAILEGDVAEGCDPQDVGRLIVSMYLGLRQASDLDAPERFLGDLEKSWLLVLSGIVQPDRIDYFTQFVTRRTALAIRSATAPVAPG